MNKKTKLGDKEIEYEDISIDSHRFKISYTCTGEIIIEYFNASKEIIKFYKIKFPEKQLNLTFGNSDIFTIYDNFKNAIATNKFTIAEKEDSIDVKLILNILPFNFNMEEKENISNIIKKAQEIKVKEILELKNINDKLNKELKELRNKIINYEKIIKEYNNNSIAIKYNELKQQYDKLKSQIENKGKDYEIINSFGIQNENNEVRKLDLSFKGNKILMQLSLLHFDYIEELKCNTNGITKIDDLVNLNLNKLQILHLYYNAIEDISPLEKVDLPELKRLHLQHNKITDITPLRNLKCCSLEILDLHNNQITDISPLDSENLKNLEKLTLHKNKIKDISVFKNVPFKKIKILSLHYNEISDISVFNEVKFNELKSLWLYKNKFNYNIKVNIINNLKESYSDFI